MGIFNLKIQLNYYDSYYGKNELPEVSYDWWKKSKARTLPTTGIGKALKKVTSEKDYEKMVTAVAALRKTIKTAIDKKCGRLHGETKAALQKYDDVIKKYLIAEFKKIELEAAVNVKKNPWECKQLKEYIHNNQMAKEIFTFLEAAPWGTRADYNKFIAPGAPFQINIGAPELLAFKKFADDEDAEKKVDWKKAPWDSARHEVVPVTIGQDLFKESRFHAWLIKQVCKTLKL